MGKREDDEFEVESTDTRSAKHQSMGRASLTLPQGLQLWKPKKNGSHTIDVVPFKVTENVSRYEDSLRYARPGKWYHERTYFVHGGIGINNETYTCLAKTFGHRCPMCEARIEYNKSSHKNDQDRAKDLRPRERQLFLVWDHDEHQIGVQLWDIAYFNFGAQLDGYIDGARQQDKEAYRRFHHPRDGFEMRISGQEKAMGEGMGKNTVYSVHQFYARERELPEFVIRHGFDLDAIVREVDYDILKKIYAGADDPADADRPAPRSRDRDDAPPVRGRYDDAPAPRRHEEAPAPRTRNEEDDRPAPRSRQEEAPAPRSRDDAPPARTRYEDPAPAPRSRREDPAPAPASPPPPPAAAPASGKVQKFASRDIVSFDYRGTPVQGVVDRVDMEKEIAYVRVEGRERPQIMDLSDLTLVKADDQWDAKPADKAPPVDDTPPPARGRASTNGDQPAARRTEWDDNDDRSFQRKPAGGNAAAEDDSPPPRRR